ncbi:MAG: RNA ligase (ATP) [Planctomycetes bacterium]|nr:RNA ligase (ATP) [Planctomycetota bacterium]
MASSLIVPVAAIDSIAPHPGADRLEVAQILGWQVVVPKGRYRAGDTVVYFPPDAVVPSEHSDRFGVTQYLQKGRVRCTRLRGEPSYGFVVLPEQSWPLGTNVAEHYGVTKYMPPLRPSAGDAAPEHPWFLRYTDIENLRNFPDILQPGEPVAVTEKLHGTNCRVGIIDGERMAGSHGVRRLPPPADELARNTYWHPFTLPAVAALLDDLGRQHRQVILFGEVYGQGIQSLHYGRRGEFGFAAFDLMVDHRYLDWQPLRALLAQAGVPMVPVLHEGPFAREVVRQHAGGQTTLADTHIKEGIVVRPFVERTDPRIGRVVLKYLSDSWLLDTERSDYTEQ